MLRPLFKNWSRWLAFWNSRPARISRQRHVRLTRLETLESRTLLTAFWDGGELGLGEVFDDPENWVGDIAPAPGQDVVIGALFADRTIYMQGDYSLGNITAASSLMVGSVLTVSGELSVAGTLELVGTLRGASVTAGTVLEPASFGATTLDGVTINGDLLLDGNSLSIVNGLSLNGQAHVVNGTLQFWGEQSVVGSGTIHLGSSSASTGWLSARDAVVTFGTGITIDANYAVMASDPGTGASLRFLGPIIADAADGQVFVHDNWSNAGTITVQNGAQIEFYGAGAWEATGVLNVDANSQAAVHGSIDLGGNALNGTGTVTLHGTLSAGTTPSSIALDTQGPFAVIDQIHAQGDIQINGRLTVTGGLILNGELFVGNADTSSILEISGTQSITGTGTILIGSAHQEVLQTPSNRVLITGTAAVTFGSELTVQGSWGQVVAQSGSSANCLGTLTNTGIGRLEVVGDWTWGAAAELQTAPGGVIYLEGEHTMTPTTEMSGTGTFELYGLLSQGLVTEQAALIPAVGVQPGLLLTTELSGVRVDGALVINNSLIFSEVRVTNGLILNGIAYIGDENHGGQLYFDGTQSLSGTGTVLFSPFVPQGFFDVENTLAALGGSVVTIAPAVTVRGARGQLFAADTGAAWNLQGTVRAESSNQSLVVTGPWTNSGVLAAITGGTLRLDGPGTWAAGGGVSGDGTGAVSVTGTLDLNEQTVTGTGELQVTRTATISDGTIGPDATLRGKGGAIEGLTVHGVLIVDGTHPAPGGGFYYDTLTVREGLILNGTAQVGGGTEESESGELRFSGEQTLGGTGTVEFGALTGGMLSVIDDSRVVFGPDLTARTTAPFAGGTFVGYGQGVWEIQGTLIADSSQLYFEGHWELKGTVRAENAGEIWLQGSGLWGPNGVLDVDVTSSAHLSYAELDLQGHELGSLGTAALQVRASTIRNGTIPPETTVQLLNEGFLNIFDNLTIEGLVYVLEESTLRVENGLVVNGTLQVGDEFSRGFISFLGPETIAGDGTIIAGTHAYTHQLTASTSGEVVLGPDLLVRGFRGAFFNNGTATWNLEGTYQSDANGLLQMGSTYTFSAGARAIAAIGSIFRFQDTFTGTTHGIALYGGPGTYRLASVGTAGTPFLMELVSEDRGAVSAGFAENLAIGTLDITGTSRVKLVDGLDDTAGAGNEALYVNTVNVAAGSTLDLNGLHLYTRNANLLGTVINGMIQIVTGGVDNNTAPAAEDAEFTSEEHPANGTAIGTVLAADPNAGDLLTFNITAGNPGNGLVIHPQTGVITVNNRDFIDFESTPIITLTVTVTDLGGLTGTATITINLTDTNDQPQLQVPGGATTYSKKATKQSGPIQIAPGLVVLDADQSSGWAVGGGTLTLSFTLAGKQTKKAFKQFDTIGGLNGASSLGTTTGPSISSNGTVQLQIQLHANTTVAMIQSFLRGITFSTRGAGLKVKQRTLMATLTDAEGATGVLNHAINVTK